MNCCKITVVNLHPTISERLNRTSVDLDVPFRFSLRLTKDMEGLTSIGKLKTEGALRFNLPFTDINNLVFMPFQNPQSLDNPIYWYDVIVVQNGASVNMKRLFVIERNEQTEEWVLELTRDNDHWVERSQSKKINTIKFGEFKFWPTQVETSWDMPTYSGDYTVYDETDGQNPTYYFPICDYGAWVDQREKYQLEPHYDEKMICLEDLRPWVNLGYLLKRGFCEIGWTLDGFILETSWSRSLWVYLLKELYYQGTNSQGTSFEYGRNGRIIGRVLQNDDLISFGNDPMLLDTLEFALGTNALKYKTTPNRWLYGIQNAYPFYAKFKFTARFYLQNAHASAYQVGFVIGEVEGTQNDVFTGELLSDYKYFDVGAGTTDFLSMEFECVLAPGQKAAILHNSGVKSGDYVKKGAYFRCEHNNESLSRFDIIDVQSMLRDDVYLMDVFKAYIHLIQGRFVTNVGSKTLTVYPKRTTDVYGTSVEGFINESGSSVDINHLVVQKSIRTQPVRKTLKRWTLIAFADSTDTYIEDQEFPEIDPPYSRRLLNGEDLTDEVEDMKNPLFEPTLERQPFNTGLRTVGSSPLPYFPVLHDNSDGERSFNIGPRLLFAYGLVSQLDPSPINNSGAYCQFMWEGYTNGGNVSPINNRWEFGYATMQNTLKVSGSPAPPYYASAVFKKKRDDFLNAYNSVDLYTMFYLGLTQENRGGTIVEVLMLMDMNMYSGVTFRDIYTFRIMGRPVSAIMSNIKDFRACEELSTPVSFFVSPAVSACCDNDFSCRYSECEYYFDFGPYMTQSTLNTLAIRSFKINDKEILTGPVTFGMVKLIDVLDEQYMTNMVDALNSIGAPYFIFNYSTRKHASKGLRYFKLKRPATHTFTIEIGTVGETKYRYTNKIQEQSWFGSGFSDFGYGATFHGEPIDCTEFTEY